jgi:hypothetical protein
VKAENIHHPMGLSLPNTFANGGSLLNPSMHTALEMSTHASRLDVPPNLLSAQSLNVGMIHGINGGMIKSETGYTGSSTYMFDSDGNVPEVRPTIGDTSVASYTSVESNAQPLTEPILDADTSSFGFLGQIPRNFSLSDLTADFSQSSGLSSLSLSLSLSLSQYIYIYIYIYISVCVCVCTFLSFGSRLLFKLKRQLELSQFIMD